DREVGAVAGLGDRAGLELGPGEDRERGAFDSLQIRSPPSAVCQRCLMLGGRAVGLVLAVATVAGCSGGSSHRTSGATTTAVPSTTTSGPATSTTACAFTGDTTEQRGTASGAR